MNKGAENHQSVSKRKKTTVRLARAFQSFACNPIGAVILIWFAISLLMIGNEAAITRQERIRASLLPKHPFLINPVDEYGLKRFSYDDSLQVLLEAFTITIDRTAYMGTGTVKDTPNVWLLYDPITSESILPRGRFKVGGSWQDTASPSAYSEVKTTLEVGHGFTLSSANYDLLVEFVDIHDSEIIGNLLLRCGGHHKNGVKIIEAD